MSLDEHLKKMIKDIVETVYSRKVPKDIINYSGFPSGTKALYVRDWEDKVATCKVYPLKNHSDKKFVIFQPKRRPLTICRACIHKLQELESKRKLTKQLWKMYQAYFYGKYV